MSYYLFISCLFLSELLFFLNIFSIATLYIFYLFLRATINYGNIIKSGYHKDILENFNIKSMCLSNNI